VIAAGGNRHANGGFVYIEVLVSVSVHHMDATAQVSLGYTGIKGPVCDSLRIWIRRSTSLRLDVMQARLGMIIRFIPPERGHGDGREGDRNVGYTVFIVHTHTQHKWR